MRDIKNELHFIILSIFHFDSSAPEKSTAAEKNHDRFSREKWFGNNHNTESYSDHYCLPCELQGRPLYQRKYKLTNLKIEQIGKKKLIFDDRNIRKTGNAGRSNSFTAFRKTLLTAKFITEKTVRKLLFRFSLCVVVL